MKAPLTYLPAALDALPRHERPQRARGWRRPVVVAIALMAITVLANVPQAL